MLSFYVSFLYLHQIKCSHFMFLFFIYMRSNILILRFFSLSTWDQMFSFYISFLISTWDQMFSFYVSFLISTWDQMFSFYVSFLYLHEIKCSHFMFLFFIYMRSNVLILCFFSLSTWDQMFSFYVFFFIYMRSNVLILCFFSLSTCDQIFSFYVFLVQLHNIKMF